MNNDANEKMSKKELLDKRKELIIRVSSKSKELRKELRLNQDEFAQILGISKNTVVNIENENDVKVYSWAVVMSIIILFSNTEIIKEILGEESAIEVVTKCAFVNSSKSSLLTGTLIGLSSSIASIPIIGNIVGASFFNHFNKK
ncbi:MAG: helix-turn-helix domain-containing protein [Clostridium sp.]|nr:helix-turn-helix domain-containing protein [Clostridium sp.]